MIVRKSINQFSFPATMSMIDCFREARNMGYDAFEVSMTLDGDTVQSEGSVVGDLGIAGYINPMLNNTSSDRDIERLRKLAADEGISICSIASVVPFISFPFTSPEEAVRRKSERFVDRMIEAAAILQADTVMVIPGTALPDVPYECTYKWAQESLTNLVPNAESMDINLAVENVWNHFLYSPLEFVRFVDEIGSPKVGIYYDIANSMILGYPQQWIRLFSHRIKKIHLKDFRLSVGNITGFTNLLDGDINWPEVVKALREIDYDGDLVVELIPPAKHHLLQTLWQASAAVDVILENN
jgi:L-ribulose-5-phosphate 3-epimerase